MMTSYKRYLLGLLLILLAFNYIERHALGLLLQEIKVDLSLSDTQLGLLTGIAFALFYSVLGLPIARWADRGDRVTIIALSAALSGIALAMCGLAGGFGQLLLIRIGLAVGEAGCVPPAHSLIAEQFGRAERPKAVAIYKLGIPLSTLVGTSAAGWLNELHGWRTTFILLGLPGVLLGVVAWWTLKEPRRRSSQMGKAEDVVPIGDVVRTLAGNASFRNTLIAYSVGSFFSLGIYQWTAAFFIRSHGLGTAELGTWLASIWGFGGLLGIYLGGVLASRFASGNERLQLRGMATVYIFFGVLSAAVYLAPTAQLAFTFMALSVVGVSLANAPLFATIQTLVPGQMRAMSIAAVFLFSNLVGLGAGPFAVGALSDAYSDWAGEESLRYALLTLCPGYALTAWFLWRAGRTVRRDLQNLQDSTGSVTAGLRAGG